MPRPIKIRNGKGLKPWKPKVWYGRLSWEHNVASACLACTWVMDLTTPATMCEKSGDWGGNGWVCNNTVKALTGHKIEPGRTGTCTWDNLALLWRDLVHFRTILAWFELRVTSLLRSVKCESQHKADLGSKLLILKKPKKARRNKGLRKMPRGWWCVAWMRLVRSDIDSTVDVETCLGTLMSIECNNWATRKCWNTSTDHPNLWNIDFKAERWLEMVENVRGTWTKCSTKAKSACTGTGGNEMEWVNKNLRKLLNIFT